jgi:hypothetical protein
MLSVIVSNPNAKGCWFKDGLKLEADENINIEVNIYSILNFY